MADETQTAVEKKDVARVDLTSVPIPDLRLYPKLHDPSLQRKAYRIFVNDRDKDFVTVAEESGVALITVLKWADLGDWVGQRDKLIKVQEREEAQQLSVMRMKRRKAALEKQIGTSGQIRDQVDLNLARAKAQDAVISPDNLKKLGEAAKAASDVEARALGVADGGLTGAEAVAAEGSRRQPLVVIIPGGGLPSVRQSGSGEPENADEKAVDVESTDVVP